MDQRAEIIPEAYPNLKYTGFIAEIAPEANRAKSTIQVKVKVENPDQQLRPEMNARVNFLAPNTAGQENSSLGRVLVPKQAVVRKDNSCIRIRGQRRQGRAANDQSGRGNRRRLSTFWKA